MRGLTRHVGFLFFAVLGLLALSVSAQLVPFARLELTQFGTNSFLVVVRSGASVTNLAVKGALVNAVTNSDVAASRVLVSSGAQVITNSVVTTTELGTLSGLTGSLASGTYTPALTIVANLDATPVSSVCQYSRVGNVVTVSGKVTVNPTTTLTLTQLGISLPIASALSVDSQVGGASAASAIAGQSAAIRGDVANDRAEMIWVATDVTDQPMFFTFSYLVL